MSIKNTIEESFKVYAGMTIMDRAICDVRDCLKPSARMSLYAQYIEKITADKPYRKAQKSVAAAMDHFYVHGDLSLYPMLARMGKPFAMRYVLEDFQGNTGTMEESGNEAASRYTEMRLSPTAMHLFTNIEKNTISKWYDSYSGEEQYPSVLPSVGYYNIVNGTSGIATGLSSSIPQFNLREVNEALITLLNNPEALDDDLICMPDFCTGAYILNADEVRESLKVGRGAAVKLRSVVTYDNKERKFIVSEVPYGVYTATILAQIKDIVNGKDNPGIERALDFSGTSANLEIYLVKNANPDKVLKYLYKNTYLQYHYAINMIMLDNGKVPKYFGWKEALSAHLNHEREVYVRGFEFDLKKIESRLHIVDGLLICLAHIEEVIQIIKSSTSTAAASSALCSKFLLDAEQAKAVLDMKLSRLAHLEVKKLEDEQLKLFQESEHIKDILAVPELLNKEIEKGLREVAEKFGDDRRTKVLNLTSGEEEPTEIRKLQISLTNKGNLYAVESSSLYTQKRGGVGAKAKLGGGELVIDTIIADSTDTILFFMNNGNFYHCKASEIELESKIPVCTLIGLKDWEKTCSICTLSKNNDKKFVVCLTKNGILKKSSIDEYHVTRAGGAKAIELSKDDELVDVLFLTDERIGLMTKCGNFIMITSSDIRALGRISKGIRAIKLNEGDSLVSAKVIKKSVKEIVSISELGYIKRTSISEFTIQSKNTKGSRIQKLMENDFMSDFLPINDLTELTISATASIIRIKIDEVPQLSKGAIGNKAIKLMENNKVINIQ